MYEAFKSLGALSIAIGWASMLFLVFKWRGDKSMSFSRHAAAHKSAFLTMAIMESIFLPMYFVFIATWFVHAFQLPVIFTVLNAISVIGLLVAAWVPDVPGIRGEIHHRVCYPAYASMPIIALFLAFSGSVGHFARVYNVFAFIVMSICGVYIAHKAKTGGSQFLLLQGLFLASIHSAILITVYVH